jgi:hypothetical protein
LSKLKIYSELKNIESFIDRYNYLKLSGQVGESTFGFDRYLNQRFYSSMEWKEARRYVIIRDNGCDLGVSGYEIHSELLVHHMNPITENDIIHSEDWLTNPEYLITTTKRTHNAIHFGDDSLLPKPLTTRRPGDTKLW